MNLQQQLIAIMNINRKIERSINDKNSLIESTLIEADKVINQLKRDKQTLQDENNSLKNKISQLESKLRQNGLGL